jgi:hypothetical protein
MGDVTLHISMIDKKIIEIYLTTFYIRFFKQIHFYDSLYYVWMNDIKQSLNSRCCNIVKKQQQYISAPIQKKTGLYIIYRQTIKNDTIDHICWLFYSFLSSSFQHLEIDWNEQNMCNHKWKSLYIFLYKNTGAILFNCI